MKKKANYRIISCISKFSDSFQYKTEKVNSTHKLIIGPIAKLVCPITFFYNNITLQHRSNNGYIVGMVSYVVILIFQI